MMLTRWATSLFQQNARSVSGKISPHSPLSFHYREGRWTSWRFWVTPHLQLLHRVPFFKTSYRQFELFSYIYGKKDFRKRNIFFSPTYVFFLTLPHHWGLLAEQLSLRKGGQIRRQIQQIWIWAFRAVLEVGWLIEQCSLGILQRQENLTVTHLLHVVIGGIKNSIVKLLTSPKVSWNQVDFTWNQVACSVPSRSGKSPDVL